MPLSVTVEASENFPNNEAVTLAKLRKGAKPSVAITGSVGGVDIEAAAVSNTAIASDAAIALTKLQGQTDNHILLVGDTSDTAGNSPATKFIETAEGYEGAAIELEGGKAKITPSNETITADKLSKDDEDNVIFGLPGDPSYTAATDDYVMVHDTDATTETRLKKVTLSTMQKVGSTEYTRKDLVDGDGISEPTANNFRVEVDMGGAAFQTVNSMTDGKNYTFAILEGSMPGSGTVRTVSIRITGPQGVGDSANLSWSDKWQWPEKSGNNGPSDIENRTALLSLTAFGNNETDVVAAFVETVTATNT